MKKWIIKIRGQEVKHLDSDAAVSQVRKLIDAGIWYMELDTVESS